MLIGKFQVFVQQAQNEINSLCRGSIVLLSSHLEAFIRDLGELALTSLYDKAVLRSELEPRFFYYISQGTLSEIKNTEEPNNIGIKIFEFLENESKFWSKGGTFPSAIPLSQFNHGFSNPGYNKIKTYFKRFGFYKYNNRMACLLKGNYATTVNMVNHLVETRNAIAHGDMNASKTPLDVEEMADIVKIFCKSTDIVFATWWKSKFCTMR